MTGIIILIVIAIVIYAAVSPDDLTPEQMESIKARDEQNELDKKEKLIIEIQEKIDETISGANGVSNINHVLAIAHADELGLVSHNYFISYMDKADTVANNFKYEYTPGYRRVAIRLITIAIYENTWFNKYGNNEDFDNPTELALAKQALIGKWKNPDYEKYLITDEENALIDKRLDEYEAIANRSDRLKKYNGEVI